MTIWTMSVCRTGAVRGTDGARGMARASGIDGSASGAGAPARGPPSAAGPPVPPRPLPPTNAWARRTILERAQSLGLPGEVARQVGNVALWYYNRAVVLLGPTRSVGGNLRPNSNRYLVPITLALACEYKGHRIELDRILRIGASPTRETMENAHRLYASYAKMLAPRRRPVASPARVAPTRPLPSSAPDFRVRPPATARPAASTGGAASVHPTPAAPSPAPSTTALATLPSEEILRLRRLRLGIRRPATGTTGARARQPSTNAWARRRIAEQSRLLRLPDRVRSRALELYDRIVDFHGARVRPPPGRRVQLSPRLNWSLVPTTIYLACRLEEYPRDLRDILALGPQPGSLRETYRLYRFYKRALRLRINLVDVRTFIQSWIDGYEIGEILQEKLSEGEMPRIRERALALARRAGLDPSFRRTSTKMIAAGAFTTALAERERPGNLAKFYRALASLLHLGEAAIRTVAAQFASFA